MSGFIQYKLLFSTFFPITGNGKLPEIKPEVKGTPPTNALYAYVKNEVGFEILKRIYH